PEVARVTIAAQAAPAAERDLQAFTLAAGATFQMRMFQASGFGVLPVYQSSLYPSLYAAGSLSPFAWLHSRLRDLALFGSFERSIVLRSRTASAETFDTEAQRFEAGLSWRFALGGPGGPTFRPRALYGRHTFTIDGASDMPNTAYSYLGG